MAIDTSEVRQPSPKNPMGGALVIFAITALVIAGFAMLASGVAIGRANSAEDAAAAAGGTVVTLTEYSITPRSITAPVNGSLTVKNGGTIQHNLAITGSGKATKMLNPGESAVLKLDGVKAGNYSVLCQVSGHDAQGMTGTLTVGTASGTGGAAAGDTSNLVQTPGLIAGKNTTANDQLDAVMAKNTETFVAWNTGKIPPITKGVGGVDLAPTVEADGTKVFNLTASIIDWEVSPGKVIKAMAYNNMVPGPTIRTNPGDRVKVVLKNELPESTTIHFHGIKTPNDQDGVPVVTQPEIKPGETYTYAFTTSKQPEVGTYHSHHHAQIQVSAGLFGPFINGQEPTLGKNVSQELSMVLNDTAPIGLTLNAKSFPATSAIVAKPGDTVMIHYMNEGMLIHPMHLHGLTQTVVAKDGFPLPQPYDADTVMVAPGERYTVVVTADVPGAWAFHCHILSHAETEQGMFGMVTAMVVQ